MRVGAVFATVGDVVGLLVVGTTVGDVLGLVEGTVVGSMEGDVVGVFDGELVPTQAEDALEPEGE